MKTAPQPTQDRRRRGLRMVVGRRLAKCLLQRQSVGEVAAALNITASAVRKTEASALGKVAEWLRAMEREDRRAVEGW